MPIICSDTERKMIWIQLCLQITLNPILHDLLSPPNMVKDMSLKTSVAKPLLIIMLSSNPSKLKDGIPYDKWKGADTRRNISEINIIQPETQTPLTVCQYDQLFSAALTSSWLYFFSLSLGEHSFAYGNCWIVAICQKVFLEVLHCHHYWFEFVFIWYLNSWL